VPDGNGTGEAGSPAAGDGDALSPQQVAIARFQLLCEALDLPPAIVPAILDWVDADSETRFPNGAEDDYYTRLERPYRAANGPFGDVSELRLVRGVTDEIHARLAPFVTVIGRATAINVNTAPAEILMSLGPGIDRGTAEILIGSREIQPFTSVEMLLQNPVLLGRPLLATGLSTSSSYFELRTRAVGDDLPYFRRSLLERTAPTRLRVVRREVLYSDG
jgi:general secretion pathway protein K